MRTRLFLDVHKENAHLLLQVNSHLKLALRRAVGKGLVVQMTGTGASGRFKLPVQKSASAARKVAKPTRKTEVKKKSTERKPKTGTENDTAFRIIGLPDKVISLM